MPQYKRYYTVALWTPGVSMITDGPKVPPTLYIHVFMILFLILVG